MDKISPNPFQPRKEFDMTRLQDLADSIRMYGMLQPLVVTRKEIAKEEGGLAVEYELISGERRLRASKIAGLSQVPALIRDREESDRVKLELAIIENLQREDLNSVDRARAFQRLVDEFHFKHGEIGVKVGKSREYVSNTLRILLLPEEIIKALSEGKISEGHTRPILMLMDRPEEQMTLFKEIVFKKINVREAELIARKIAFERARKKERIGDPEIIELEDRLKESLGTRVHIEREKVGGKVMIDFFSIEDLRNILGIMESNQKKDPEGMLKKFIETKDDPNIKNLQPKKITVEQAIKEELQKAGKMPKDDPALVDEKGAPLDDRSPAEKKEEDNEDLGEMYSVKNFSI